MTRLAQLIARQEGFGIPGAIPTVRHNPGDLRHSPHSQHPGGPSHANDIGTIDTNEHGWEDLDRQLRISAATGVTIREWLFGRPDESGSLVAGYAPEPENNTSAYLEFICSGLGLSPDTTLVQALEVPAQTILGGA